MAGTQDSERYLTALGKEQADLTGQRLAEIIRKKKEKPGADGQVKHFNISVILSTMTRATETAQIILKHFPDVHWTGCDLIREGAPCEPVPALPKHYNWNPDPHLFF